MPTPPRSVLRWLAPSAITAIAGGLAAGIVEAIPEPGVLARLATVGFVALAACPLALIASLVVRGALAAWQPRALVAPLIEADGAAPRFAAWIAVIWLATIGLGWAAFQGTWLLAAWTAFKPLPVSFAEPLIALATLVLIAALSRPSARLFTALFQRIDRRWRKRGHDSLFTVPLVLGGTALVTIDLGYVVWLWLVVPKVGPLNTGWLVAPAVGVGALVAVQVAWSTLPRARRYAGLAIAALGAVAMGTALVVRFADAELALAIWSHRPLAARAIEAVFAVDAIRDSVSTEQLRPVPRPGAKHPDIVLVTIDSTRADRTPPYGGSADMPVLRELAGRGTVFVWAFAPSNETTRSMMAIALGLLPNRIHGRFADPPHLDPRHVALTERLRAGGYQTAGFLCCELWGQRSGLPRGFEHVEVEPDSATLVSDARTWLAAHEADHEPARPPLFVWVHLAEPRDWSVGTTEPRTDEERKRLYDRQLAAADTAVGEILGAFSARTAADAPVVIVTSDHGEPLGDHARLEAGTDLFDSQIRVPLVIAGAGIKPQRTEEVVGLVDLAPTIIELAGFAPPYGRALDGRSLYDLATGRRAADLPQGRAFAISASGSVSMLVRTNWKLLINNGIAELYDLAKDPDEHANIAISNARLVQQLRTMADEYLDGAKRLPF